MAEGSSNIVVLYKGANILSLPYKLDKAINYFDFKPGNNKISSKIWNAVKTSNEKRMTHYKKYLEVLVPEVTNSNSDNSDIEEVPNPSDYNADEAIKLIKGCMELEELKEMQGYEENGKNRSTVLSAIEEQKEEIEAFLKKLEEEKD